MITAISSRSQQRVNQNSQMGIAESSERLYNIYTPTAQFHLDCSPFRTCIAAQPIKHGNASQHFICGDVLQFFVSENNIKAPFQEWEPKSIGFYWLGG
jgi:hypothetical protein